jgi:hypothetical protein
MGEHLRASAPGPWLNEPGKWKVFISHVQREAKAEAGRLYWELGGKDGKVWLDVMMSDCGTEAMMEGVINSDVFLLLLSPQYFTREFCILELRKAQEHKKQIVLAHTPETKSLLSALFDQAKELKFGDVGKTMSVELLFHDHDHAQVAINKIKRKCNIT